METQLLLKMCKGRRKNTGDTVNFLGIIAPQDSGLPFVSQS